MSKDFAKYARIFGVVIVLVIVVLLAVIGRDEPPKPKTSACGVYRKDKKVQISGQTINAEVAATPAQLDQGLGGRPCILPNQGMMFVFNKPGRYAFWMKDMKFPIDIVWIGADHKIAGMEVDVQPSTYPDRFVNKDTPAQYVLELKANRTNELHMDLGSTVTF